MKHFYNLLKSLVLITCVFMAAGAQKAWAAQSYDYEYYFQYGDVNVTVDGFSVTLCNNANSGANNAVKVVLEVENSQVTKDGNKYSYNKDEYYTFNYLRDGSSTKMYYFDHFDVTITDEGVVEGTGIISVSGTPKTIFFHHSNTDFNTTTSSTNNSPLTKLNDSNAVSYENGEWTINIFKTSTAYLELHVSGDENGFNAESAVNLSTSKYWTNTTRGTSGEVTAVQGFAVSGNPLSGNCEISGFVKYGTSTAYCKVDCSFYTLPSTINGTESSLNWNYDSYYGYSVTFADEDNILIKLAYFNSLEGEHTLADGGWSTLTIDGGEPIWFSSVTFTIDGDIWDGFSVEGSGTLSDGRVVSFNASNKKEEEPEEPQEFVGDVSSLIGISSDIKFDGVNFYDWFIEFTNSEGIKVVLDLPKATDNIFAGTYDTENGLWDGYGIYTEDQNTGDYYSYIEDASGAKVYFDHLTVVTTGDPNNDSSVWSIIGEGTLTDETPVRFYCDKNYGNPEQQVTITEAGWATYYNPSFSVTLPEGVEGYVAYVADGEFVFGNYYAASDVVPAGTAIVLKGDATDYIFNYAIGGDAPYANDLLGAATDITAAEMASGEYESGYKFYALALDNETNDPESIGFYWLAANGGAFALEAGKAYLPVADNGNTLARGFSFNDALGISDIKAEKEAGVMYNVYGQRVKEAKGLVVREGKMMFVK